MRYTAEITIDRPREEVVDLVNDPGKMKHWQPGFISYEPITGIPGKVGSKLKLRYEMSGRDIEMIETINKIDFPNRVDLSFDADGVQNTQINLFERIDNNTTKWVSHNEFQFSRFLTKLMRLVMPGAFKKQTKLYLEKFKEFAENQKH